MDDQRCLRTPRLAGLLSLALLAACSSGPLVRDYVAPVNACCARIADFRFRPLPLGQELVFDITAADSTFRFPPGRAGHFVAFRIPEGFSATAIQSKSYLSTDFLPKATALLPDFIFLDDDYRELGRAGVKNLQERSGFWGAALGGTVTVPRGSRYFIVVAGEGDGSNRYHSENGRLHPIPAAALGKLSLRLFGEAAGTSGGVR